MFQYCEFAMEENEIDALLAYSGSEYEPGSSDKSDSDNENTPSTRGSFLLNFNFFILETRSAYLWKII